MRSLFILFIIPLLLYGCKSTDTQEKCFDAYVTRISTDPEFNLIRSAAMDTTIQWGRKNLRAFSGFNHQLWQMDSAVYFNEDKSKALLLLLQVDKRANVRFDNVKMIAAEKINDDWNFYAQSMPTIGFDRTLNSDTKPYTFEKLSEASRKEIINGGFFKNGSCSINYDYINDWFKIPLAEYHHEFL